MSHYISREQMIDAITRANDEGENCDGTYRLIPSWVSNARVWFAERIEETSGFEVAFDEIEPTGSGLRARPLRGGEGIKWTFHTSPSLLIESFTGRTARILRLRLYRGRTS